MSSIYKVPLVLTPQAEGGYVVTSPMIPELVTEGDSLDEAIEHVRDALKAVIEIYEDLREPLPADLSQDQEAGPIEFEHLVAGA
jgi:antitoxin HicB